MSQNKMKRTVSSRREKFRLEGIGPAPGSSPLMKVRHSSKACVSQRKSSSESGPMIPQTAQVVGPVQGLKPGHLLLGQVRAGLGSALTALQGNARNPRPEGQVPG